MASFPDWIVTGLMLASAAVMALWTGGAVYFDVFHEKQWGRWLALGWLLSAIAAFVVWRPIWQPFVALLGLTVPFVGWWLRQKPTHDRDWDPAVAVLPRAIRENDLIAIVNVRDFEYRSLDDYTPHYETRPFHLANLRAVDIIFFNWGSALMSHPVLVFDFGPDGRICFSIEVRYQRGQKYSILRSLYHYSELIFLAVDERDAVLRRTKYGTNQEAHLYRLNVSVDEMRATFLDYIEAVNRIHDTPQWYNGLCRNCTTTFYRLPSSRRRCDWRVLANARLDHALYAAGRLDRTLPFERLRQLAYITDIANHAPKVGFSDYLRRELERRRHD